MQNIIDKFISEKSWLGKTGRVTLLGPQGKILGTSDSPQQPSDIKQHKPNILKLVKDKRTGVYQHEMIGAFTRIDPLDLVVVAEISWYEAMEELFLYLKFSMVTAGFALICVLIIVVIIARRLSAPILKIASATRKIAQGDLNQSVLYHRDDEIGMLVDDFNSMGKQLEATQHRLIQSQALAATGKMVASIVHEIRNPLSSIKMNLQILTRRIQNESRYKEHGDIALQELRYMENTMSELLDFSRPVQLQRQRIDIDELVKESLQAITAEVTKNQNSIHCDIPTDAPVYLLGDLKRMKQVLCNLILNAVQASESKQQITIKARVQSENNNIILKVIDNGKGVAAENLEHIFSPFFTTRDKGTGLGLSHVKKIIELHEGTITVESLEQGTRFVITLPQINAFSQ